MKARKYDYLYVLQGKYECGWEDLCAEDKSLPDAWKRIRASRKEYRENEGGEYRIVRNRRELREAA